MDYFFGGQEGDRAAEHPMIVMLDETTDNRYMRAVNRKGLGDGNEMEWLVKDMHEELKSWGHAGGDGGELILKSDGEPSIRALRDALGRYHGGKVTPELPPPGESQSNGRVEEAGKTLRGYIKVFMDMLEEKVNQKLPTDAVVLQWLVRWVAMLHSRFRLGPDGKSAYERQRGRKCRLEVIPFGETVHYRKLSDDNQNKLESQWEKGIWLGHARGSNEVLVGTRVGVVRAWAIKRNAEGERWCAADILNMQGTPARPNPQMPGNDVPIHIHVPLDLGPDVEEVRPPRVETEPRRTYLKAKDFEEHGYTVDCEGCRRLRTGGMMARPHSVGCRARMEEILKKADNPRYRRYREQADQAVWEEIQRQEPEAAEEARGSAACSSGTCGGQAASSSNEGGIPTARTGEGKDDRSEEREAKKSTDSEEDIREGKRGQEEQGGGAQKRRGAEHQGVKREGAAAEDPRQASRRRVQEEEQPVLEQADSEMLSCLLSVDVAELYSPPRVADEAKKFKLQAREAMDLTTGWDFNRKGDREKAVEYVETNKPLLVIGSPMCTMFSQLQRFTSWTAQKQRRWEDHKKHMEFVTAIYEMQAKAGRLFLHEHPTQATSWDLPGMRRLRKREGVHVVEGDQCMFGLTTFGQKSRGAQAARKRTKFMTNSCHIANELDKKCDGSHAHQLLVGGRAKDAVRYPKGLCRAICRGLVRAKQRESERLSAVAEVLPGSWPSELPDPKEHHEDIEEEMRRLSEKEKDTAYDDITGMPLDRKKVQAARMEEMEYVRAKSVWVKIPRAEAARKGYKVIQTRWIDINKGDDVNPVYRSRFVAKEFNTGDQRGLFAGTPPLEGLRYLVHEAATWEGDEKVIMINDVARAFFEAEAVWQVCIEPPEEDRCPKDQGKDLVGLLKMSLYGTRDAAKNWQDEVARVMKKWGFI